MTVKDLILELQRYDENLEVEYPDTCDTGGSNCTYGVYLERKRNRYGDEESILLIA